MHELNYQHLRYFWMIAREGNLTRAAKRLRLAPSTISAQLKTLEAQLGHQLFERRGRQLHLTEYGQVVREYADDIFALGEELVDAVRHETRLQHAYRLRVGVSNNLPKSVAYQLLSPALKVEGFPVHLVVREDHAERLVAELAIHQLDLVLSDAPVALGLEVAAESRLLGATSVSVLGTPALVARHLTGFPQSLHGAPMLLPEVGSNMRSLMERFFQQSNIRPQVVAEFGDSALLKAFGQAGAGLFPVATLVSEAVCAQYRSQVLGQLDGGLRESFYAITATSKRRNRAVTAVLEAATSTFESFG